MNNSTVFIKHLQKYVKITKNEEAEILSFFERKIYTKKENLKDINTITKYHYFVMNGCLRMFFINEKGMEQTIQFALENWWITDYASFGKGLRSDFAIQAMEQTEVLQIDNSNQDKLLAAYPQLERYFRKMYQIAYGASQMRSKYLYEFTKEQFYAHFNDNFPDFSKRIPQQYLASYLHMTPEYLSEIKKKNRS